MPSFQQVHFDQLYAHAYSGRPGTPAADWDQQLSEEVKQDRLQRLKRLAAEHALERSQRYLGREQEVLVEGVLDKDPSLLFGRNPQNRLVYFHGRLADLKPKIVSVLITEARAYSLMGELRGEGTTDR